MLVKPAYEVVCLVYIHVSEIFLKSRKKKKMQGVLESRKMGDRLKENAT